MAFFYTLVRVSSGQFPGIDSGEWGWGSGRIARKERGWGAVSIQDTSTGRPATLTIFLIAIVALGPFGPQPCLLTVTEAFLGGRAKARARVPRPPSRSRAGFELGLQGSEPSAPPTAPQQLQSRLPPVSQVWLISGFSAFALGLWQLGHVLPPLLYALPFLERSPAVTLGLRSLSRVRLQLKGERSRGALGDAGQGLGSLRGGASREGGLRRDSREHED